MKRGNPMKNRIEQEGMPQPRPDHFLPKGQEPKRIAPRERGPGTKVDPLFRKLKKKLRGY
jgi:hypothetical protein